MKLEEEDMVYLRRSDQKKNKAFTLGEIMAVIVIIGVMAGLAFPNFLHIILRMKTQESINLLYALYSEQLQYKRENGNYATTLAQLDIDIPSAGGTYDNVAPSNNTHGCGLKRVGFVTRLYSPGPPPQPYILNLMEDGKINCFDNGVGICDKVGLSTACNQ